jgi:hypothetical protein
VRAFEELAFATGDGFPNPNARTPFKPVPSGQHGTKESVHGFLLNGSLSAPIGSETQTVKHALLRHPPSFPENFRAAG